MKKEFTKKVDPIRYAHLELMAKRYLQLLELHQKVQSLLTINEEEFKVFSEVAKELFQAPKGREATEAEKPAAKKNRTTK